MLKPGILTGRDLVDASGQVLLYRGVVLTDTYIDALRRRGYDYLYIKDADDPDVDVEEDLNPVIRLRAIRSLNKAIEGITHNLASLKRESLEDTVKALSSDNVRALMSQRGFLAEISSVVSDIIEEILTKNTLGGLTSMKSRDTRLYEHSIDVCVIGIMIGKSFDLPGARMRQLATGCLLHDIGMLFVDAAQSEHNRIRQHTILGYELLRNTDDPDLLSPHVAYEHHEHQDGTGLPRGLVGSNRVQRVREGSGPVPTLIGEIAAVANAYDNLLSGSPTAKPMAPDTAIAKITQEAGTKYNREVVSAFRRVVPVFPKGTEVILSGEPYDRFRGLVSDVNPQDLEHPFVVLLRDAQGNKITPLELDMLKYPHIELRVAGF